MPGRDKFLRDLDGRWSEVLPNGHYGRSYFEFDLEGLKAKIKSVNGVVVNRKDVSAHRVCLSKVLDRRHRFEGYRIIELEAENNAGIAVMAVKFEKNSAGRPGSELHVTDYRYYRWGQEDEELRSIDEVFGADTLTGDLVEVHVFPGYQPR